MSKNYDVDSYILYWAHRSKDGIYRPYNDLLMNCINSIKKDEAIDKGSRIKVNNRINVIYDCDDWYYNDMIEKINGRGFRNVNLIKDYKNKGASGARNIAIENTVKNEKEGINKNGLFVILDNDMKVPFYWLENLVSELVHAEKEFGVGCVITYDQMPYLEEGLVKAGDSSNGPCYKNIMDLRSFVDFCRKYNIPCDDNGNVSCREAFDSSKGKIKIGGTGLTFSGWRLSNFIITTRFVREAERVKIGGIGGGFSSEELSGFGREDLEWAVRVFKTPCVMLESHTVFVQHLMAFTSGFIYGDRVNNEPILRRLLGDELIAGFKDGSTWNRLRQSQMTRYGYKG
jgi:hypothetical protein